MKIMNLNDKIFNKLNAKLMNIFDIIIPALESFIYIFFLIALIVLPILVICKWTGLLKIQLLWCRPLWF